MTHYRTTEIDGLNIFYREAGDNNRPGSAFTHCFPASSFMFRDLTERLSDQFHIFAPDYPGFGYSDAPSTETFADAFDRLADIRRKYRFSSYRTLPAFNDLSALDPAAHRGAAFFSVRKSAQSIWNQITAGNCSKFSFFAFSLTLPLTVKLYFGRNEQKRNLQLRGAFMFKISEFSKISQVSVKTLRYYDQLNLLKPAHTDPYSGYRYYTADQLFQLHRILAYKELGFSLEQILRMIDELIPLEQIRGMFRIKQHEIQSIVDKEQAKLARIQDRLHAIENEGKQEVTHNVVLKEVEPQLVVSYRQRTSFRQIPEMFRQLDDYLGNARRPPLSQIVLWHDCLESDDDMDIEAARLLTDKMASQPPFVVQQLPGVPLMATLIHHCRTTSRCTASTELALWIERNGYRMIENEPRREICIPHEQTGDPEAYVAEVQIAVERA